MTAKQYLQQLARLQTNIKILQDEIEERRTRLTSTTMPLGEKVQSSPSGDRFADMIASLADRDLFCQGLICDYEDMRDRIVEEITGLENEQEITVLYERYVRGKYWDRIASEMHYSKQHIFRIHGRALVSFAKKYPQRLL